MKTLLIVVAAFMISSAAFAQDKMDKKKMDQKMDMKKDHMHMKDGKMEMVKGGKTTPMDKDMTLSNGDIIKIDGTMKMKNGKTMKLQEGDMVYMDGTRGKM